MEETRTPQTAVQTIATMETMKSPDAEKKQEDTKMVFCVRNDLKMGKGKIAAQCGHATVECTLISLEKQPELFRYWHEHDQTKVALRVESLEELEMLEKEAKKHNLVCAKIIDLGRTQIKPNTVTVLGIGPDTVSKINEVTQHLKLLN
ncbi:peptidyl-tRNA hydrolase, putative [Entamoeba invadens IP1]|uniref:peptidyl-tRNA hydrolase n=1 Tax=Entamoeba invadens IP1 TaxID=370355 RepID=A0A0A1TW12_ENTIV|nr:peptidyl-tRNA hydrolase, putative [Entamoeba invadens IP1]ELP84651.1 peptidyl-tRNA hydrolase, putative [Entamoeba invadens IP1]|eukprot:XP_004183997.1 peptidyl-tRNA hydrolase, putative [Entamoeba invadens IP1]